MERQLPLEAISDLNMRCRLSRVVQKNLLELIDRRRTTSLSYKIMGVPLLTMNKKQNPNNGNKRGLSAGIWLLLSMSYKLSKKKGR